MRQDRFSAKRQRITQSDEQTSIDLAARVEFLAGSLGYSGRPGYLRAETEAPRTVRHVLTQAFRHIGVAAVFGLETGTPKVGTHFIPMVYLGYANDAAAASRLHMAVWSQGVVPILIIVSHYGVQIRNGFEPSIARPEPETISWEVIASTGDAPAPLTALHASRLASSLTWRNYILAGDSRVDKFLLSKMQDLVAKVMLASQHLDLTPQLVNAAIGRFLYLFILVDRGFLTQRWVDTLADKASAPACPDIKLRPEIPDLDAAWPKEQVWALFEHIDTVMNGSVFPIQKDQWTRFDDHSLHLIRRVLRNADTLVGDGVRQMGLFDVSFSVLRTESISGMYELFLEAADQDAKREDGAFYTPPFLVDFVLDAVEAMVPIRRPCRMLDPSSGSGLFLVGAYRRLVESERPPSGWSVSNLPELQALLKDHIFGIERNEQAADIARFSLQLTLLDYLGDHDFESLTKIVGSRKIFPDLSANILHGDAFGAEAAARGRFTHVLGNPPWGSLMSSSELAAAGPGQQARKEREAPAQAFLTGLDDLRPVAERRQSELFAWRVERDLLAESGVFGLIVSTRTVIGRRANAFPNAFLKLAGVTGVADFSHFRYHLFQGAKAPALAIVGRKPLDARRPVWVFTPRLDTQAFAGFGNLWSIITSPRDVRTFQQHDLVKPNGWFDAVMLRAVDQRLAAFIRAKTEELQLTFGDFLERTGLVLDKGVSPSLAQLPAERRIDSSNYPLTLGLEGAPPSYRPLSDHEISSIPLKYRRRFSGRILLIPRSMRRFDVVEQPIFYSSTFNALMTPDVNEDEGAARLRNVAGFLSSSVARYLFGLVGQTWRLDSRRLERKDLLAMPFPFRGVAELAAAHDATGDDGWIKAVVEQLGLKDSPFVDMVAEYDRFGRHYEDGQVPPSFDEAPDSAQQERYRSAFESQLSRAFGETARIIPATHVSHHDGAGRWSVKVKVDPAIGGDVETDTPPCERDDRRFTVSGSIAFRPDASEIVVTKPWTTTSWSLEQAYEDAAEALDAILGR